MPPTDLTPTQISALTRILQLLPTENAASHATRITPLISALPTLLKRPSRISTLILSSQTPHTSLCKLHKPLNNPLIHSLFTLLALEAGRRLNTLVAHNHRLTRTQRSGIHRLRELHSLWLPPDVYQKTFLAAPNATKWTYQADGCEACILARIGGDMAALLDLRMVLRSRTSSSRRERRRRHGPPRLLAWIERWVASLSTSLDVSSEEFEALIAANDAEGLALKEIRTQLWRERREARRAFENCLQKREGSRWSAQGADGDMLTADAAAAAAQPAIRVSAASTNTSNHTSVEDDSDSSDAENDIIDAYAALTSTPYLPSIASTVSLHQRRATYIFPTILTTHENADIQKTQVDPIRPPPTNFAAITSDTHTHWKTIHRLRSQGHRPKNTSSLQPLTLPPSPSLYSPTNQPSPVDSYIPPRFPVHEAYIAPTANAQAKRYQNLLSPNPLLRDSEEELRIPETPGLPRRSSKRFSPPRTDQCGDFTSATAMEPCPMSTSPLRENGRDTRNSSVSSMSRSQTTRGCNSRMSSLSVSSVYSADLMPAPLRSSSKSRAISTFTIKEGEAEHEVEADSATQRSGNNLNMRRSKTTREHLRPTVAVGVNHRERRYKRESAATDMTRWSDSYKGLDEEVKQ